MKEFFEENVSRETFQKLLKYEEFLLRWNKKINLISKNTEQTIWERHFLDSWQILPFIPLSCKTIADMGSGAGFPGLVIAIFLDSQYEIHLIESDLKKSSFLLFMSSLLKLNVRVHKKKIQETGLKIDFVISRALSSLSNLLEYSETIRKDLSVPSVFLKGKNVFSELKIAEEQYIIQYSIFQSHFFSEENILYVWSFIKK